MHYQALPLVMVCPMPIWPVDRSCLPALPAEDAEGYEDAVANQDRHLDMAAQVLFLLSGQQFGVFEVVARPCPTPSLMTGYTGSAGSPRFPMTFPVMLFDGVTWKNVAAGCVVRCQHTGPGMVHLPGPATEIVTVTIGDEGDLDPSQYVLEGNILYRRGESTRWPDQNLSRPLGEPGTWSVRYGRGIPVPEGVGAFVAQLAREFLAACAGESCRLPRNVVAVTSRGVSKQFDPSRIYASGKTGLSEIDLWLSAVNPHHLMAAPKVL